MKQLFIIMLVCMISASCQNERNRELAIAKNNEAVKLFLLNFKRDSIEKAIPMLEEAAKTDPTYYLVHVNLARCYCMLNKREKAMDAMDKAIEANPKHQGLYLGKAMLLKRYGAADGDKEVEKLLEKTLEIINSYPESAEKEKTSLPSDKAIALLLLGREEEGRTYMANHRPRYAEITGNNPETMKQYDFIMNGINQPGHEKEMITDLVNNTWRILSAPTYVSRAFNATAERQMSAELDNLLKQFSKIVDAPEYAETGVPENLLRNEAMPLVQKMIAVSPKDNYPRILLYACHVALKDYDKAMELADSIGDSEDKRASLLYRGYLYDEMGNTAKADEMYRASKKCYEELFQKSAAINACIKAAEIIGLTEGYENMRTYLLKQSEKIAIENRGKIRSLVDNLRLNGFDRKKYAHSIATESINVKFNKAKANPADTKLPKDMMAVAQDFVNHSSIKGGIKTLLKWHDDCEKKGYGAILDKIMQVESKKYPNTSTAFMEWHGNRDNGVELYKMMTAYKECLKNGDKNALEKELTAWADFCTVFDRFILEAMEEKHDGGNIAVSLYQSEMRMVYAMKREDFERQAKLINGENVYTAKQTVSVFCNNVNGLVDKYDDAELKKAGASLKEKFNAWQTARTQIAAQMPKNYNLLFADIEQRYSDILFYLVV